WGFNYNLNAYDDDFRSDAGFVNRTGIVSARAFNRLTWYGEPGGFVETAQVFFGPNRIWTYDGFLRDRAIEGDEDVNLDVRLRGVGVETPTWQKLEAGLGVEAGRVAIFPEGSRGYGRAAELDLTLRPTSSLRVLLTGVWEQLWRDRDDSEFARTIIPRVLLEFQPTRAFFLRGVGEYRAERRAALLDARTGEPLFGFEGLEPIPAQDLNGMRVDLLAAYEPRPGIVAYLGYGATLRDAEAFRFRDIERSSDGLF